MEMESEVICKCGEGWSCVIKRTDPSQAGTPFSKCGGGSCTCITDASKNLEVSNLQQTLESYTNGKVFCKCGPGWTCIISKTEGPQAGKAFIECGEGCVCVVDETNALKVSHL
ncbi:hypothetical protein LguiA_015336 [Lonicera macranthoides]